MSTRSGTTKPPPGKPRGGTEPTSRNDLLAQVSEEALQGLPGNPGDLMRVLTPDRIRNHPTRLVDEHFSRYGDQRRVDRFDHPFLYRCNITTLSVGTEHVPGPVQQRPTMQPADVDRRETFGVPAHHLTVDAPCIAYHYGEYEYHREYYEHERYLDQVHCSSYDS